MVWQFYASEKLLCGLTIDIGCKCGTVRLAVPFYSMFCRLFIVSGEDMDRIFVGQLGRYVVNSTMLHAFTSVYSLHSCHMEGACILITSCVSLNQPKAMLWPCYCTLHWQWLWSRVQLELIS